MGNYGEADLISHINYHWLGVNLHLSFDFQSEARMIHFPLPSRLSICFASVFSDQAGIARWAISRRLPPHSDLRLVNPRDGSAPGREETPGTPRPSQGSPCRPSLRRMSGRPASSHLSTRGRPGNPPVPGSDLVFKVWLGNAFFQSCLWSGSQEKQAVS